jgi:oxygen-independent coproporphyrinogen-3 oxidase
MVDRAKVMALRDEGLNRASIGIQDFAPEVQQAIGRISPSTYSGLRGRPARAGIRSLNADLVYGLPHQSEPKIARTVEQVLDLATRPLALYGYAHVPGSRSASSSSTRTPCLATSPATGWRPWRPRCSWARAMKRSASTTSRSRGMAWPGCRLGSTPAQLPGLHRRHLPTLIGLGASSISRFPRLRPERPGHGRL